LLDDTDDLELLGGRISHSRSPPAPIVLFFKKAVLEGQLGHNLLESQCLGAQILDVAARRLTGSVPGQTLLASLEELL
jgi:hypothetical protein